MRFTNIHFNSLFLLSIIGSFFFECNVVSTKKIGLLLNNKKLMNREKNKLENIKGESIEKNLYNKREQLKKSDDENLHNRKSLKESNQLLEIPLNLHSNGVTGNFTIVSFLDNEYEVYNRITKQFTYYNVSSPFDEFQIAKNIKCNLDNCKYPNVCLNDNMCGCDNHFANIKTTNNNRIKNCDYLRKSPIITSILELIVPGAGFFYSGSLKYAVLKFLFGVIVITLLFLQVCGTFKNSENNIENIVVKENQEKDEMITNKQLYTETIIEEDNAMKALKNKITFDKNTQNNTFNKNFNLNLLIISSVTLLIWLFIDFVMIGMRINKDGNGVGFTIYANYGNSS